MARFTLTEAVRLTIAGKDRIVCFELADELKPILGFRPGEANVSRAMLSLGWEREIAGASGRIGYRKPQG